MINEVLMEIMLCLRRDELDKMELVTREHRRLISQYATKLPLRVVNVAVGATELFGLTERGTEKFYFLQFNADRVEEGNPHLWKACLEHYSTGYEVFALPKELDNDEEARRAAITDVSSLRKRRKRAVAVCLFKEFLYFSSSQTRSF